MKGGIIAGWVWMAAASFLPEGVAGTYGGGSGTAADPYQIGTVADWTELRTTPADWNWGKQFILTADLDFEGATLTPVGTDASDNRFLGTFDGRRHVLRNAAVGKTGGAYVGVFGFVYGGIRDLGVENISVTGSYYVGGLVGYLEGGTISNSYAEGTVSGGTYAGGLVGGVKPLSMGCTIADSHAKGTVVGSGHGTGGLVGFMDGCQISNSYAECSVTGDDGVGGLVGQVYANNRSDQIVASYAAGSVSGKNDVGGLVGLFYPNSKAGQITTSFATGSVSGQTSRVGGLVGHLSAGTVTVAYASGRVGGWNAGTTHLGGLVGQRESNAVVTASYWDSEASGQASSEGGEGRTTEEMTYPHATNTYAGWDFDVAWVDDSDSQQNNGYPYLGWQTAPWAIEATNITASGFCANWLTAEGATNYLLDVATDAEFTDFVTGYQDRSVGNVLTEPVTGLADGATYYYRLRVQRSNGTSRNSGTIRVVVLDISAPEITVPEDMLAEATCPGGAVMNFSVIASDLVDTNPVIMATPASGSMFPIGETLVTVTATDASSNTATASFTITVVDIQQSWVLAWGYNNYGQCNVPAGLTNAVAIAAGGSHGLALKPDGTVVSWGTNLYGECDVPADLTNAVAIAAGRWNSLALRADGGVVGWGHSSMSIPGGLTDVVSIAAGFGGSEQLSLALRANGTVVAWGDYYSGQLAVPPGLSHVVKIASGGRHALALRSDGTVVAWGTNNYGQCNVPADLTNVIAIAAGGNVVGSHSLVLRAEGTVVAWGYNANGQCNVPAGLSNVVAISAGNYHSLAVRADGSAVMWGGQTNVPSTVAHVAAMAAGYGNSMALCYLVEEGEDTTPPSLYGCDPQIITVTNNTGSEYFWQVRVVDDMDLSPTVTYDPPLDSFLPMGDTIVTVTARDASGNTSQGQFTVTVTRPWVVAWGNNQEGQCAVPAGMSNVVGVASGWSHSLALKSDGTVEAWGGDYTGKGLNSVPPGLSNVVAIAAEQIYNLALKSDGTVVSWGNSLIPVCSGVTGLTEVVAIAAGQEHGVALKSNGSVVAWGTNNYGQCNVPSGLTNVIAIAAAARHSLAVKSDGTVVAWGYNIDGQCNVPVDLTDVVAVSAGWGNYCLALRANGTVVAWGNNWAGQTNVPAGLTNVVAIKAAERHCIVLCSDGTVVAWGGNQDGQCNVPVGLTDVTGISGGYSFTLALIGMPAAPIVRAVTDIDLTDFTMNWLASAVATNYLLDVATGRGFANYVSGYQDLSVGNVRSMTVTGLTAGARYYCRLRAQNTKGTSGNSRTIAVTVADTTAPVITVPADIAAEATGPTGAAVDFQVGAVDLCDPSPLLSVEPATGSVFPLGETVVVATASDDSGNTSTASFKVTVVDTTAPAITVPSDIAVEAAGPEGTAVPFDVPTAIDMVDPNPSVTVDYASGDQFALGETVVTATAKDSAGNTASASFTVTVMDTTAPVINGCTNQEVVAWDGSAFVWVTYAVTVDDADANPTVTYSHESGSLFPVGDTRVTVTAWDASGNTNRCEFTVTVVADVEPPAISGCENHSVSAWGSDGAVVECAVGVSDADPNPTVTYSHASGSLFPTGDTVVTVTAWDASGNTNACEFTVSVRQSQDPISYWRFDEGADNVASDRMGVNPAMIDGASWDTNGLLGGACLRFDGIDDFVLATKRPSQVGLYEEGRPDLTLMAWFTLSHGSWFDQSPLVAIGDDDFWPHRRYVLSSQYHEHPAPVLFAWMWPEYWGTPFLEWNHWYHAALTIKNSEPRRVALYLDGILMSEGADVEFPISDKFIRIGRERYFHQGMIDEVAIFNHALEAGEVRQLYERSLFGSGYLAPDGPDTTPPVIRGCNDMTITSPSPSGVAVTYAIAAYDNADPNPVLAYVPPSGSTLSLGDTRVTVTAWDASGNTNTCEFTVTVVADAESPAISGCTNRAGVD